MSIIKLLYIKMVLKTIIKVKIKEIHNIIIQEMLKIWIHKIIIRIKVESKYITKNNDNNYKNKYKNVMYCQTISIYFKLTYVESINLVKSLKSWS